MSHWVLGTHGLTRGENEPVVALGALVTGLVVSAAVGSNSVSCAGVS